MCVCARVCVCVRACEGGREVSANKKQLEAIKTPTHNTNSHTEHSNTLILACITVFTDTHVQHKIRAFVCVLYTLYA